MESIQLVLATTTMKTIQLVLATTTMKSIQLLIVLLCFLSIVMRCSTGKADNSPFLDCPGNDNVWGVFRRCCASEELPNGCECFDVSMEPDFSNTWFYKPQCPEELGVQFHLYTRNNKESAVLVKSHDGSIRASPFNGSRAKTTFIVHGFRASSPGLKSLPLKDALLDEIDMNVIIVNWKQGACCFNYYQAAANARSVGSMLAQMVRVLKTRHHVDLNKIHLVGHSLGAHASGFAGKEILRLESALIGRITGLDPASVGFEHVSPIARLDKSDASFVDVIHTDAEELLSGGFGIRKSIGHVDFYPNGGQHQPGCPVENFGILNLLDLKGPNSTGVCSHMRCWDYYTKSVYTCHKLYHFHKPGSEACMMGYHTKSWCRGDHYPIIEDPNDYNDNLDKLLRLRYNSLSNSNKCMCKVR